MPSLNFSNFFDRSTLRRILKYFKIQATNKIFQDSLPHAKRSSYAELRNSEAFENFQESSRSKSFYNPDSINKTVYRLELCYTLSFAHICSLITSNTIHTLTKMPAYWSRPSFVRPLIQGGHWKKLKIH